MAKDFRAILLRCGRILSLEDLRNAQFYPKLRELESQILTRILARPKDSGNSGARQHPKVSTGVSCSSKKGMRDFLSRMPSKETQNLPPRFSRVRIQDKNAIGPSVIEVEHLGNGTGNSVKRSLPDPLSRQPIVFNEANH